MSAEREPEKDVLAVKPAYWTEVNGEKVWSDDVNDLFAKTGKPRKLRRELLPEYFAQGWICAPDTIWEGVYKRPLEIKNLEPGGDMDPSLLIHSSVERSLSGKVCNWFSGGIDSSLLTAYAVEKAPVDMIHFHMTLGDGESDRVARMEQKFGFKAERMVPTSELCKLYPELCRKMGEPIADPGIIAAYWLGCESKKRGCVAVLSGMGGDELDAGYPRNRIIVKLFNSPVVRLLGIWPLKLAGLSMCGGAFVFGGKRKRDMLRLGRFLKSPDVENYYNLFGYFSHDEISVLTGDSNWQEAYGKKIKELTRDVQGVRKFFAYEFQGFLASHNNVYGYHACKAAGVECRTPLLTPEIARACWRDIDALENAGKKRLTKLLAEILGDDFISVRKSGFRFPVEEHVSQMTMDDFSSLRDSGLICEKGWNLVRKWIEIARSGDVDEVYMKLWAIWTLSSIVV